MADSCDKKDLSLDIPSDIELLKMNAGSLSNDIRIKSTKHPDITRVIHARLERIYAEMGNYLSEEALPVYRNINHEENNINGLKIKSSRIIWFANSINIYTPERCSHTRSVGATLLPLLLSGKKVSYVLCALPCGGIGSPEGNASNTTLPTPMEMSALFVKNLGQLGQLIDTSSCNKWRTENSLRGRIQRVKKIISGLVLDENDCIIHQGCVLGSSLPMHLLKNLAPRQYLHMMCYDNSLDSIPEGVIILSPNPGLTFKSSGSCRERSIHMRPSINMVGSDSRINAISTDQTYSDILSWLKSTNADSLILACGAHLQSRISLEWITEVREAAHRLSASILLIGVTDGKEELIRILTCPTVSTFGLNRDKVKICGWVIDPVSIFRKIADLPIKTAYVFPGESGGGGHDQICASWNGLPIYLYGPKDSSCSLPSTVFYQSISDAFKTLGDHWSFPAELKFYLLDTRGKLKERFMEHILYGYRLYADLDEPMDYC